MATEMRRATYVDPAGTPLIVIERGRPEGENVLPEDVYSGTKVIHGGRTLREDMTWDEAVSLAESMGGIAREPGDEFAVAAEIGGTAVMQHALAPRVSEIASDIRAQREGVDEGDEEQRLRTEDVKAEAVAVGTGVPDSQTTGVMEIVTGLGGVRSHGLGERFEGAADEAKAIAEERADNKAQLRAANAQAGAVTDGSEEPQDRPTANSEESCNHPVGNGECVLPAGHEGPHRLTQPETSTSSEGA